MNETKHPTRRMIASVDSGRFGFTPRTRLIWQWLLGSVLLIAGIAIGCGLTILYFRSVYFLRTHTPESVIQRLEADIARKFALTPDEKRAINESIERNVAKMEKSREIYNENTRKEILAWRKETYGILGHERAEAWLKEVYQHFDPGGVYYPLPGKGELALPAEEGTSTDQSGSLKEQR